MITKDEHWCAIYLTRQSIIDRFPRLFGYKNDSLAVRFYNFLSDGFNMKQIYLPLFLVKLYGLIGSGSIIEENYFAFKIIDGDSDG